MNPPSCCLTFCTCPDSETALKLADHLIEHRLAACVNLIPGLTSVYRWEGAVQRDQEVLLAIKSTAEQAKSLIEPLYRMHPYDTPEIIRLPISGGLPDYLNWIAACATAQD